MLHRSSHVLVHLTLWKPVYSVVAQFLCKISRT